MPLIKTVALLGTAASRAQTTLVSRRIDVPFVVQEITLRFPPGAQNLLSLALWLSPDDEAPTTGDPTGTNLLQEYSQATAIRGDAIQITLRHHAHTDVAGMYLKVVAVNDDWYDHAIDAAIEIAVADLKEPAHE